MKHKITKIVIALFIIAMLAAPVAAQWYDYVDLDIGEDVNVFCVDGQIVVRSHWRQYVTVECHPYSTIIQNE